MNWITQNQQFMLEAPLVLPWPHRSAAAGRVPRKNTRPPTRERPDSEHRNQHRFEKRRRPLLQVIETRILLCRTAANPGTRYLGAGPADHWPDRLRSFR